MSPSMNPYYEVIVSTKLVVY